ncbi:hypothetical protein BDM02DRAFT_3115397 [Thelephora ganbajun]|uniref:Uncharacterized protein n=1 Tax=Thelephora ganbajun TaxID=370292 RepID=A0ACB6ZFZ2_THEGA|nr:hypothetical protein BDM02DRAFT_3115397 [Thelephora ganbajun]
MQDIEKGTPVPLASFSVPWVEPRVNKGVRRGIDGSPSWGPRSFTNASPGWSREPPVYPGNGQDKRCRRGGGKVWPLVADKVKIISER